MTSYLILFLFSIVESDHNNPEIPNNPVNAGKNEFMGACWGGTIDVLNTKIPNKPLTQNTIKEYNRFFSLIIKIET